MLVTVMKIQLHASWVHSLKEKRMIVKSLLGKICSKFNVSAIEAAQQDIHQIIVLGIVYLSANSSQADSISEHISNFIEGNTEAEIMSIEIENR